MHIWTIENWKKYFDGNIKSGLTVRYEKDVNGDVKRSCREFTKWLKSEYIFPVRVNVYFKASKHIRARDGENCSAEILLPFDKTETPYIKISTGEYEEFLLKRGRENALASMFISLSHELTHYFQWINNIRLTKIGTERQATTYAKFVMYEYYEYTGGIL